MRFYEECVTIAQQLEKEMTQEARELFIETQFSDLWQYHYTIGMWIRNHHLDEKGYLYRALLILGKKSKDDMSMFLLEFIQQYFLLKRAEML